MANELRKEGTFISDGGVRSVWVRHNLETMKKRLKALEAKMAKENGIYTEEQLRLVEKQKDKGVGRIYQQTFVDTYSKVAICKLYNGKSALAAADTLNDRVLPFFTEHKVPPSWIIGQSLRLRGGL